MAHPYAIRRYAGRMPNAPAQKMGTWKLAYADFLTALAAFFLVMWLVKGVPETGRAEIAEYFAGAETPAGSTFSLSADRTQHIAAALSASHALAPFETSLDVERVGDTLRIDLMDHSDKPLFERGGTALTGDGERIVAALAPILGAIAAPIAIEGHTDAFPVRSETHSNWSLSSARADTTRRLLLENGVQDTAIASIVGYGSRHPKRPREPHHASNRRVTLVLQLPAQSSKPLIS